jgi:hypothetical protein
MARKKKPENETQNAAEIRRVLEYVSNVASRGEKTSWNRKMDNMVKLIAQLTPIEERIFQIMLAEKQPIMDQINDLRSSMIQECVHPFDHLILKEDHVVCKFCNRKIGIPSVNDQTTKA